MPRVATGTREAHEAFHYTFSNDKTLDVDNVDGTIQVIGDNGNTIRVEGEKIIRAEDQQALDRAKREVKLDVNEKDGIAQLYVNGPFATTTIPSDDHGFHIHFDDHEYEVTYNFTIHVPAIPTLRLRTVNGDVKTEETRGKFDIHGVNGSVTMTGIAGSGNTRTVNGRTAVSFRENPKGGKRLSDGQRSHRGRFSAESLRRSSSQDAERPGLYGFRGDGVAARDRGKPGTRQDGNSSTKPITAAISESAPAVRN